MSPLPGLPTPIYLRVSIGEQNPEPIPTELTQALWSAEINRCDVAPSGFQLVFGDKLSLTDNDFPLLDNALFTEFNRVRLEVIVEGTATTLIEGFITNKEVSLADSKIVLTGEDLSLKMDLFEISKEYPQKTDSTIATEVLGRYQTFDITADVVAPQNEVTPEIYTPHQLSTDRDYLKKLARNNDSLFYLKFGTQTTAYWGPPERSGTPQPTLTSNTVMFGNVEKLEPEFDALSAELNYGSSLAPGDASEESADTPFGASGFADVALSDLPVPLQDFASLTADPESFESELATLKVKGKYMKHQHLGPGRVGSAAQAATDRAASQAVKMTGELDTGRYGHVLEAPGIVGVRGCGATFDGRYYVQSVTHKFSLEPGTLQYKQAFVLTREGLGTQQEELGA